jgi:N6-adenosine-specific RNA methylase IME4/ParB-like chromosome segregation protein Spo0J
MLSHEFHRLANLFPLITGKAFDDLVEDIKANGIREPLTLYEGKILDGRNRYFAWERTELGPDALTYKQYEGNDPVGFVLSSNMHRRHMSDGQRAWVAAQIATLRLGSNQHTAIAAPSQEQTARLLDVSTDSIQRAALVRDHGAPELQEALAGGDVSTLAAAAIAALPKEQQTAILEQMSRGEDGHLTPEAQTLMKRMSKEIRAHEQQRKKASRASREKELGDKQLALPEHKYGVVVSDCEWSWQAYSAETGMDRAAANHYPVSPTELIAARPVADIAADDCVLFMWATVPMLKDALHVMETWGFEYKSQYVWVKDKAGTGYWNRNKHEILLIGTKGSIPAPAMGTQYDSAIEAPVGKHSAKPEIFLEMIEAYYPTLPKIELNRRGPPRFNWHAWGLESHMPDEPLDVQADITPDDLPDTQTFPELPDCLRRTLDVSP